MKRKRKKVYRNVVLDKSCTLKEQIKQLLPVTELQFYEYLDRHGDKLEKRSIGYVERYYNDYGDLLAVQDGINLFYIKGGADVI